MAGAGKKGGVAAAAGAAGKKGFKKGGKKGETTHKIAQIIVAFR